MDDARGAEGDAILWGRHEVAEALAAGHPVNRIFFARQASGPQVERIKELARQGQVRFDFVEVGKLGRLAGTRDHQDVVARISPVAYARLQDALLPTAETATVVALDQVQNTRNVGMVIRTAAGAGARAVLLPTRGGRLVNDEVVRASAGTIFRVPIVATASLRRDLETLKQRGFWIYGLDPAGEEEVFSVEWPARRVLVAGNETRGLRPVIRKSADALVRIPLAEGVDSLNVAVALGVALFEIGRQDRQAGGE